MLAQILAILADPSVVTWEVGGVIALWHFFTSRASTSNQTLGHVLDAARNAASAIVATVAPGATIDEVTAKVLASTNKLLGAAKVDATSPLIAAAINAVVHDAVQTFVTQPPPPPASAALHAALVNLSQNPPAKAAGV